MSHLMESDLTKRAEMVLKNADKMECRKFVQARNIVKGHQKLNLAFCCTLFNAFPCLDAPEKILNIEETREEKTYRNWMNSLGVKPFVTNIYYDLQDGMILFHLYEQVLELVLRWFI